MSFDDFFRARVSFSPWFFIFSDSFSLFFYLRRQLAAGQVMGHVVVVVVVVLDFKTFTHISRDPTLKKVLLVKSPPISEMSWQVYKL